VEMKEEYDMCVCTPKTLEEAGREYVEYAKDTEKVVVRLKRDEVERLKKRFDSEEGLSTMDVISGWWVDLIERNTGPVDSVIYTINVSPDFTA
jgi:hypothetical protein